MKITKELLIVSAKEHLSVLENRFMMLMKSKTYGYTGEHHKKLSMFTITEHMDITKGIIVQLTRLDKPTGSGNVLDRIIEGIRYNNDLKEFRKELENINAPIILEEVY